MKIVQINSVCGVGSTGRIAVDIAEAAEKRGHVCYIAFGHGQTAISNSYKIGNKLEHLFHNAFFTRLLGLHGYGSIIATVLLTRWLGKNKPDIIHIHNIHANYLNYRILFRYIIKHKIPVVFTLHDCFNFTGKCSHYTFVNCEKWKTECGNCPVYKTTTVPSLLFDQSRRIYNEKKKLYSSIQSCSVVAVSQWLKGEAEQSILNTNGHSVYCIYNWIDCNKFKRASNESISVFCKKYGLERNIKYLVSVNQLWRKNTINYLDAVNLSNKLPAGYKLVIIGGLERGTLLDPNIIHISYITSQEELAVAYSLAEAYVHFSIQDTFGLVIGEAMACGTIPITYSSTACAEVPGGYGIVVQPRDINAIIEALPQIEEKKKFREEMIQYVKDNYDKFTNTNKYVDLYEQMINE